MRPRNTNSVKSKSLCYDPKQPPADGYKQNLTICTVEFIQISQDFRVDFLQAFLLYS